MVTWPWAVVTSRALGRSTISGTSSRISNTRVAPAPAWSAMFRICANWFSGRANMRANLKNEATVPTSTVPLIDSQPPASATSATSRLDSMAESGIAVSATKLACWPASVPPR